MQDSTYDVIVIGAGPGGYVAAIRASQLGLRCAIVEREHLGGICLNWGCIPTKALLRSAEIYRYAVNADAFGVKIEGKIEPDAAALVSRSRRVSAQLNNGVGYLLKKNKIDVIWGEASISGATNSEGAREIVVRDSGRPAVQPQHPLPKGVLGPGTYRGRHIIIATGARPRVLPGIEPDGRLIWSYFEAMKPPSIPRSVVVLGSGAIGIEFASFFRALGADVTVVELLDQILSAEDAEIAALARSQFEKQGMRILTGAKAGAVVREGDSITLSVQHGGATQLLKAERLISAVGVVGNTEGLGLEELGVQVANGLVATDGLGRANVPGIYAIGDVAGPPMLAHKAEHEGVMCVEAIAGLTPRPLNRARIPGCTYCTPQIASVGLTEAKAKDAGIQLMIGRFPFRANGKAIALGESEGLVKTIFDATTGRLIGAHMIGAEVTELIHGFVIAMHLEATQSDLVHAIFPHPTLSEMMHESALSASGRAIHI
jgi:dihydrolipoyl dehydrogenase